VHAAHLLQRGSQLALQDRADAKTSWRTYPSAGFAVPYHYNTETRASVWVTPPELAAALAEVDAEDEAARRGGQGSLVRGCALPLSCVVQSSGCTAGGRQCACGTHGAWHAPWHVTRSAEVSVLWGPTRMPPVSMSTGHVLQSP